MRNPDPKPPHPIPDLVLPSRWKVRYGPSLRGFSGVFSGVEVEVEVEPLLLTCSVGGPCGHVLSVGEAGDPVLQNAVPVTLGAPCEVGVWGQGGCGEEQVRSWELV